MFKMRFCSPVMSSIFIAGLSAAPAASQILHRPGAQPAEKQDATTRADPRVDPWNGAPPAQRPEGTTTSVMEPSADPAPPQTLGTLNRRQHAASSQSQAVNSALSRNLETVNRQSLAPNAKAQTMGAALARNPDDLNRQSLAPGAKLHAMNSALSRNSGDLNPQPLPPVSKMSSSKATPVTVSNAPLPN